MALNSRFSWVAGFTIALLAVCFAGTTQAGTRMYQGSLIIHAFANDVTTGSLPPFNGFRTVGIPLINQCNLEPFHAKETLTFYLPAQTMFPFKPAQTNIFTIPAYGGQTKVLDTNGDTIPDKAAGCGTATQRIGAPMYGAGPVDTVGSAGVSCTLTSTGPCTNPRQISMPQWALRRHIDGTASFEQYGLYLWEVHYADLHNQSGVLLAGGGDGDFTVAHVQLDATRKVIQKAGPNQFGGVMELMGFYGDREGYFYDGQITSIFYYDWLFNYLGAGGQNTDEGVVDAGYIATSVQFGYTKQEGQTTTSFVDHSVFKWTTGTLTVTAFGGTFPTSIHRVGYDKRTANGSGVIQLVAPMITKWAGAGTSATGAIGIMTLTFAPEPSEWMLLASGVSMLGLVGWRRSRRP